MVSVQFREQWNSYFRRLQFFFGGLPAQQHGRDHDASAQDARWEQLEERSDMDLASEASYTRHSQGVRNYVNGDAAGSPIAGSPLRSPLRSPLSVRSTGESTMSAIDGMSEQVSRRF